MRTALVLFTDYSFKVLLSVCRYGARVPPHGVSTFQLALKYCRWRRAWICRVSSLDSTAVRVDSKPIRQLHWVHSSQYDPCSTTLHIPHTTRAARVPYSCHALTSKRHQASIIYAMTCGDISLQTLPPDTQAQQAARSRTHQAGRHHCGC